MMTKRRNGLAALISTAVLSVTVAGCGSTAAESDVKPAPASEAPKPTQGSEPSETATAAGTVPEELHGTWLLDVPRDQIGANLEKAGLGKIVDRFYKSEDLGAGQTTMILTLSADYFEITWRLPDKTWRPGWYGPASVEDEVLILNDEFYTEVSDSYRPSVDGDQLTLEFVESSVSKLRGFPIEAWPAAYFAQPWTRADCTPPDYDACL